MGYFIVWWPLVLGIFASQKKPGKPVAHNLWQLQLIGWILQDIVASDVGTELARKGSIPFG